MSWNMVFEMDTSPAIQGYWEDMFGFTKDVSLISAARMWIDAAILDGWMPSRLYDTEDIDSACRLILEEKHDKHWTAQVIARRSSGDRFMHQVSVNVWGPDSLAVQPPYCYNMKTLRANLALCSVCKKTEYETTRYSFCNRICVICSEVYGPGPTT